MYLQRRPTFDLLVFSNRANECVVAGESMNSPSHILFNKTPEQLRRLGARGGRAYARNQRARRLLAELPQPVPAPAVPAETAAEAIAVLDAQFPWLRGTEK
jgi:hypothetical protein